VQSGVKTENGNVNLLAAKSTSLTAADYLDRNQFHAVSLYVPTATHQHQQQLPVPVTPTFQQPQTTFLLPTTNGNYYYYPVHLALLVLSGINLFDTYNIFRPTI